MKFLLLLLIPSLAWAFNCDLKSQQELGREVVAEIEASPFACGQQDVHLTFDDGPSVSVTPRILQELKSRNVKASFFITTTNLETHPQREKHKALLNQIISEGHLIANHGHEHKAYDLRLNGKGELLEKGFSQKEKELQINRSIALLDQATRGRYSKQPYHLFRFPYGRGALPSKTELEHLQKTGQMKFISQNFGERLQEYRRQSPALLTLGGFGYSHLGWNHDSNDSSYGAGAQSREVLKKYVLKNLRELCGGRGPKVSLFHDIKAMNAEAIPVLLDVGQCLGLKFVSAAEMMRKSAALEKTGVLIGQKQIKGAPMKTIEDLIAKVLEEDDCEPQTESSCYSEQYQRRYKECEGGGSVCFQGKWHSPSDPLVILNCGR